MKSRPPRQIKAYGLDSIMDFGKWRNSRVGDVIRLDPDYVLWAAENVAWFDLDAEAYDLAVCTSNEIQELYYHPHDYIYFEDD